MDWMMRLPPISEGVINFLRHAIPAAQANQEKVDVLYLKPEVLDGLRAEVEEDFSIWYTKQYEASPEEEIIEVLGVRIRPWVDEDSFEAQDYEILVNTLDDEMIEDLDGSDPDTLWVLISWPLSAWQAKYS